MDTTAHVTGLKSRKPKTRLAQILILSFLVASCSFTFPTREESAELERRGFFSSGAPAWVPVAGVATSYAGGTTLTSIRPVVGGEASQFAYKETSKPENNTRVEAAKVAKSDLLSKIEGSCSNSEREVNDAITTLDITEKTKKHRALVKRCPGSAGLWFLLAESLLSEQKTAQAREALKTSLNIDPDLVQAKNLQSELSE